MTNEEIIGQIAKFEKGLNNKALPESAKKTLAKKIEELKAQLQKEEKTSSKKEEKAIKEEEKAHSELEDTIARLKKGMNNPHVPTSAKAAIKKKIEAAEEELKAQKAAIKEDKKEAVVEVKQVKEAVKKLANVSKKKTPAGKKSKKVKIVVPKVEEKQRVEKSKKRKNRLERMMSDLEKLIEKNKNLIEDAARSAKPFGYRFVGKHDYRVPTPEQIKRGLKRGTIDYENRPNRSDKFPKGVNKKVHAKLEDGGKIPVKPTKEEIVGTTIMANTGVPLKVLDYNNRFGGMVLVERADGEITPTPKPKWMRLDKFESFGKGGAVKSKKLYNIDKKEDEQRFAKPRGYRWKNEAVTDGIIKKAALDKEPSKAMRAKHPDYVYFEDRPSKSDKTPSRKYKSL